LVRNLPLTREWWVGVVLEASRKNGRIGSRGNPNRKKNTQRENPGSGAWGEGGRLMRKRGGLWREKWVSKREVNSRCRKIAELLKRRNS